MTAQIGEILQIDNQQFIIAEQPLHNYFKLLNQYIWVFNKKNTQ